MQQHSWTRNDLTVTFLNMLFWLDMEMTGLDEKKDQILEVAAVITNWDFAVVEQYHQVVYQAPIVLETMDEWCKKTHGDSGLTAAVPNGKALADVEKDLLAMVARHWKPAKKKDDMPILAGNSIWNDRRFIDAYLKEFSSKLHYRMVDVSAFKEVFRSKYGKQFKKKNGHRALDDVFESINELKFYLSHFSSTPLTH